MSVLTLSAAFGDYDRTRPIVDGRVQIDGVNAICQLLSPEEMFFRAFRHQDFDICELSMSSYCVSVSRGDNQYIAVPVFLSRTFRHTSIYIRTDRGINTPMDLKDRRVGIAEYQLTANVWARAFLEEEGLAPSDIQWIMGGMITPDRPEKIKLQLPPEVRMERAPAGATLNQMLLDGDLDGFVGPRALPCFVDGHPSVGWLYADPQAAAEAYYKRTNIFPIMHVLGVRKELANKYPFLPGALLKAFTEAKTMALDALLDVSATKVTLPFVEESLGRARALMGEDFWSYGLKPNAHVLDTFLDAHHRQGLSSRRLQPEDLFHPASLETYAL